MMISLDTGNLPRYITKDHTWWSPVALAITTNNRLESRGVWYYIIVI